MKVLPQINNSSDKQVECPSDSSKIVNIHRTILSPITRQYFYNICDFSNTCKNTQCRYHLTNND